MTPNMREVTDERAIAERREGTDVEEVMNVTGQVQGTDALSSTFLHITPFGFSRTPIYFVLL